MPSDVFGVTPNPEAGVIALWDGPLSEIPTGWALCDGNNGTPNMLGKYVSGTPNSSTDPGATGGQNSFSLATSQLPSHTHGISTGNTGSHNHSFGTGSVSVANDRDYVDHRDGNDSRTTSTISDHSHSMSIDDAGSGSTVDNHPPFYEVAYIMKL